MTQKEWEKELKRRQEEHLAKVNGDDKPAHPCQHDLCSLCVGTGIKEDGSMCIHHLYCSCPKCNPHYNIDTGYYSTKCIVTPNIINTNNNLTYTIK